MRQKTMWAEFYNLGEDDGITFEITQVSLCGSTLRLELPNINDSQEDWRFVSYDNNEDYRIGGKKYSDFGVSAKPFSVFKKIGREEARELKGLEEQ